MSGYRSVTIEGTVMPAAGVLAHKERTTVAYTERIGRLVAGGFVKIIKWHDETPEPEPVQLALDDVATGPESGYTGQQPPKRNASREEWGYFLESQGIDFDDDATRLELIAIWDGTDGDS